MSPRCIREQPATIKQIHTTIHIYAPLPTHVRLRLLQRATLPHLDSHAVRWPFARLRAWWVDQLQRLMLRGCAEVRLVDGETAVQYVRRRNTAVSLLQNSIGKWSRRWASQQVAWYEHITRSRNSSCWSAQLLGVRPPAELMQRRLEYGRVRTRAILGWCSTRWTEGISTARL